MTCGRSFIVLCLWLPWILAAAEAQVVYPVDRFDDTRALNDFFGLSGPWSDGNSRAEGEFVAPGADGTGRRLRLTWRAVPGTAGCGWWMDLGPRWDGQQSVRDMSVFDHISLRLRGSGFAAARLKIEIQWAGGGRTGVELGPPGQGWRTVRLPVAPPPGQAAVARRLAVVITAAGKAPAEGVLDIDDVTAAVKWQLQRPPADDAALLELLERRLCAYFIEGQHPATGLVWDTSGDWRRCSVAACGFGLAAFCIAAERGWLARQQAAAKAERMLTTLLDPARGARVRGYFYHFLDTRTGRPLPGSEVSSVDTAILAAGALCAREYFDRPEEARLRALADRLYREIDWPWLLDRETKLFSMGFRDGARLDARWDWYSDETLLICLLAVASPTHPAPEDVMWAWKRPASREGVKWDAERQRTVPAEMVYSWTGSLFTYLLAGLWVDLRGLTDRHPARPVNWWENSRRAALANRAFCRRWFEERLSLTTQMWGASACLGPRGYEGSYGAVPCGRPEGPVFDGTVTPAGPAMALPVLPDPKMALEALWEMYRDTKLWGIYGLRDGFNPGQKAGREDDWCASEYVGVNQGLALLGIENFRSALVWRMTRRCDRLREALERLFRR